MQMRNCRKTRLEQRATPPAALATLILGSTLLICPAALAQDNYVCSLILQGCDYDREEAGTCPRTSVATATLWAEGEHWYLDTVGLTTDPADGPSTVHERLWLGGATRTDDGSRVFFIAQRQGLDGVFIVGPDGQADISLLGEAAGNRTNFETTYSGACAGTMP
jgi:hypothetical protein